MAKEQKGLAFTTTPPERAGAVLRLMRFLRPAMKRANLQLMHNVTVEKLGFAGKKASSIVYRRNGKLETAQAKREIILCAGAVSSPQLLQASGLGPANILKQAGIEPLQNMPQIGGGLQDHFGHHLSL